MSIRKPVIIPTEESSVSLRELTTFDDDLAYHDAIQASGNHLRQFGDVTASKYSWLGSVTLARKEAERTGRLRLGIWHDLQKGQEFTGSINLTQSGENPREGVVGYWLDVRHVGHGYATLAVRALAKYAKDETSFTSLSANVVDGNVKSAAVLERSGLYYERTFTDDDTGLTVMRFATPSPFQVAFGEELRAAGEREQATATTEQARVPHPPMFPASFNEPTGPFRRGGF